MVYTKNIAALCTMYTTETTYIGSTNVPFPGLNFASVLAAKFNV